MNIIAIIAAILLVTFFCQETIILLPPVKDSRDLKTKTGLSIYTGKSCFSHFGGNYRARTYDPLLVRQMLSQLS